MKKIIKGFKRFILEKQLKKCENKKNQIETEMDLVQNKICNLLYKGYRESEMKVFKLRCRILHEENYEIIKRIGEIKTKIIRLAY